MIINLKNYVFLQLGLCPEPCFGQFGHASEYAGKHGFKNNIVIDEMGTCFANSKNYKNLYSNMSLTKWSRYPKLGLRWLVFISVSSQFTVSVGLVA